jgi:glycerophosphoryl diester phosphodiesterase
MVAAASERQTLPFIAHAGGGYQNWQYTNTLQALDFNRDYFDAFEIDFEWTSDGHLVCLHDWKTNAEWIFGQRFEAPVSLVEFEALVESHPVAQNCTLTTLVQWLQENPEKRLVTDIKTDNVAGLRQLASAYGEGVGKQVIAQIYQPSEYGAARAAGFETIIWTLYRYPGEEADILRELEGMSLFAVTMPRHLALQGLAKRLPVNVYVHTVNTQREWAMFQALGVSGLYTDWLPDPNVEVSDESG